MVKLVSLDELLFEVTDIFGKRIRSHANYWKKIIEHKHQDLRYGIEDVAKVLERPDEVYESVTDSTIALYRKQMTEDETLIVLAKHLNGEGFLVTAYQTTKSKKKGKRLWPK